MIASLNTLSWTIASYWHRRCLKDVPWTLIVRNKPDKSSSLFHVCLSVTCHGIAKGCARGFLVDRMFFVWWGILRWTLYRALGGVTLLLGRVWEGVGESGIWITSEDRQTLTHWNTKVTRKLWTQHKNTHRNAFTHSSTHTHTLHCDTLRN